MNQQLKNPENFNDNLVSTEKVHQSHESTRVALSANIVQSKRSSPQIFLSKQQPLNSITGVVKDYTSEMMSSYQKSSLKNKQNNLYNSIDNTVTEAR